MKPAVWCGIAGIFSGFLSLKLLLHPVFVNVAAVAGLLVLSFALLEAASHLGNRRWRVAIWTIAGLMGLEIALLQWMKGCCML